MNIKIAHDQLIAQMNWGRMCHAIEDPRMQEFSDSLDRIYQEAEEHQGFVWRIPDSQIALELQESGYHESTSATVSVWESYATLRRYTFESTHGEYVKRAAEWFEKVDGPQLVIWPVAIDERPSFSDAVLRLQHLKENGNTDLAFGWLD